MFESFEEEWSLPQFIGQAGEPVHEQHQHGGGEQCDWGCVRNQRLTLRQGYVSSMELFSFGIDPLLVLLERVLQGILICSTPVHGPKQ